MQQQRHPNFISSKKVSKRWLSSLMVNMQQSVHKKGKMKPLYNESS
jgi:hypothetical protein